MNIRPLIVLTLTALLTLTGCQTPGGRPDAAAAARIDRDVDNVLRNLYDTTPSARMLSKRAKGILVFPGVVQAGFIGGAEFGTGAMRQGGRTVDYYNFFAGSFGFQAGAQSFNYVMFLMTQSALDHVNRTAGWELGVGPTIVVVDAGMARRLTTTTLRSDVYAFILGQRGLMGGLGVRGSKITRINP